jgi:hypothetical protein
MKSRNVRVLGALCIGIFPIEALFNELVGALGRIGKVRSEVLDGRDDAHDDHQIPAGLLRVLTAINTFIA